MALKKLLTIAGFNTTVFLLSFISPALNAQTPKLLVDHGKVWVKNIEPEVLYTFGRYFNAQHDWESVFPVSLQDNANGIVISGTYEIFTDAISFTPRFPFANNVTYKAKFFAEELTENSNEVYLPVMSASVLELEFSIGNASRNSSAVTTVYPTADLLPENILKFHICFSKPMATGYAYDLIRLFDEHGKQIEKPFLILDQELWDEEMKTLTILLDPGRIKRGLRPNLEMKPALQANNKYSLVIEKGWKDIDGNFTTQAFAKHFECGPADRQSPNVAKYRITVPQLESASLVINFEEPMDYILVSESIRVTDLHGNILAGNILPGRNETEIEFVPRSPWSENNYTIQFNPLMEDLAGNNLNRLFDEDLTSAKQQKLPLTSLSFQLSRS